MKKFWLISCLSLLLFIGALGFASHKTNALPITGNVVYSTPPVGPFFRDSDHFQPNCGPGNIYKQFDRCANESYFYSFALWNAIFSGGNWIWNRGHDGSPYPNITSAEGTGNGIPVNGDLRGFVNVAFNDLIGSKAGYGYNWLTTTSCGEVDHTEYGVFHPRAVWCEIDATTLIGTAQYVNTMLGMGGDDPAFTNQAAYNKYCPGSIPSIDIRIGGINIAKCRFFEWKGVVDYYATQPAGSPNGWVNWSERKDFSDMSDGVMDGTAVIRTDTIVFRNSVGYGVAQPSTLDTGSYLNNGITDGTDRYIVFHNPKKADGTSGGVFSINKACGNITGPTAPLTVSKAYRIQVFPTQPDLRDALGNPDSETPTQAWVGFNFTITGAPVGLAGPDASKKITANRSYYIIPSGGAPRPPFLTRNQNDLLFASANPPPLDDHATSGFFVPLPAGLKAGDQVCSHISITPNSGALDGSVTVGRGQARLDGLVLSHSNKDPLTVDSCKTIVDKPYVSFFNGDVFAGGTFNDSGASCSKNSNITGFTRINNAGTASQLAAFGLGSISGFTTASLRASPPATPADLKFSNKGTGGNFGGNHCITNYYGSAGGATTATNDVSTLTTGSYQLTGANLRLHGILHKSQRVVIYANQDVNIDGNLVYEPYPGETWNSVDEIPSLYLVVKGNIYINANVAQMDGVYIAQPNNAAAIGLADNAANKGRIYTCSFGPGVVPVPFLYAVCNTQLVVNGAFIAQVVKLERTKNSLRDSLAGVGEYTSPKGGSEIFRFTPETYIAAPILTSSSSGGNGVYSSLSNLPPVL